MYNLIMIPERYTVIDLWETGYKISKI